MILECLRRVASKLAKRRRFLSSFSKIANIDIRSVQAPIMQGAAGRTATIWGPTTQLICSEHSGTKDVASLELRLIAGRPRVYIATKLDGPSLHA